MKLTTSDIRIICKRIVGSLGIEVCFPDELPVGAIASDRAVIVTSSDDLGKYWGKCIVTLSIMVPDVCPKVANMSKLSSYERNVQDMFVDGIAGEYGDDSYLIELQSIGIDNASDVRCHFVNAKLMFNVLNVSK